VSANDGATTTREAVAIFFNEEFREKCSKISTRAISYHSINTMNDDDDDDNNNSAHTPKNADQHDLLLLKNCDAHLTRLRNQLEDLSNPSFIERVGSPSLVESMRRDTRDSLEKFAALREKLARGNLNVSSWSSTEVKKKFTLDRIRDAFETEAIYALFFERDRGGLRDRLAVVERELRLGKTTKKKKKKNNNNTASEEEEEKLEIEKIEILVALKNLGERMTEEEKLTMREGLERGVMEDLEMVMEDV
jgi:hypothetical protein